MILLNTYWTSMLHRVTDDTINISCVLLFFTLNEQTTKLHVVTTHRPQSELPPSVKSLICIVSLNSEAFINIWEKTTGCYSWVGKATRYELVGPGIESQWKRDLPCRPERFEAHPPPSSAWVAKWLELYLRFPSVSAQECHGLTFTFMAQAVHKKNTTVHAILSTTVVVANRIIKKITQELKIATFKGASSLPGFSKCFIFTYLRLI